MRVLITGGGGFIGAWLVRHLAGSGHQLRVFETVARSTQFDTIVGPAAAAVDWCLGDIADARAVHGAAEGCDGIVHLAGVLTPACKADPVRGAMINLVGTLNVFDAARAFGIRRIVFTSSAGVYGPGDDTTPRPITHYGAFKLACEGSARAYWEDHGIASIGFRPYIVYGFGRETGLTAGPSLACRAAARGEAYVIPYVGTAGLVFVDDVVAAYDAALRRKPDGAHVFNLPGEVASNDDVVAAVSAVIPDARIGIEGPVLPFAEDIGEGELRGVFPDLPLTSLRDGIGRTIELYPDQRMTLPVLGAHTFGFAWDCIAEEAVERLAAAGYRTIQLMATPPHFDPWEQDAARTKRIRALLERHQMSLLALDLASSDINLASPAPHVVDFAVAAYSAAIDRAAELGARWICVGSGRRHALLAKANDRLMTSFRAAFARIHDKAQRAGIPITLENNPQGLLATAADIARFLDAEGYAGMPVIYDVANAFAIGEDPVAGLETLWPRLGIIHLSDSPRGQWRHDPIGSGEIDFAAIAALLRRRAYDGKIVLEILSDRPLEDLGNGTAALQRRGLAFTLDS